ncbi:aldehyde dehydrogenase [Myxococcus stipitatus DSM 14675]|uniref:Aldehyde dehydrogenase n=1 Tax=Myxococcus stipitatus (strain DSM 14675 / JCM 12634 / Mx s8) TaxID=1278073 RepID=L7UPZ3_MYXSD|nr:aldehyde dehydrogenase family protein [Myxococcus stipitatus]AGC48629.1 aldehyde dehydrogenase [Myxococcus stipitatus DSM 14675]
MSLAASPRNTPSSTLDTVIQRVKAGSRTWVKLGVPQRLALLEELSRGYAAIAEQSVLAACEAKGVDPSSPMAGEEWLAGPMVVVRNLRLLATSLRDIQQHGVPRIPASRLRTLEDGRLAARIYPMDTLEGMLLPRNEGEVHFLPGVTADNLPEHQASFYRKPHDGRLCAVLGAGNVNSIPPADCLYKLFVEGTACVLKMNPVNAYLGPFLEQAFAPLVRMDVFAVVYGGAEEGAALVAHPAVDEVHITGSDKTHDALVWGPPGTESEARRARNEPLLRKPFTSELGNISPVVVVPGPYSDGELRFQADNIAGMVANNASFNCNSAKLLVQPKGWGTRARVVDAVAASLGKAAVRRAFYPGAEQRWRQFTEGRAHLRKLGHAHEGELPYALISDVDPGHAEDRVFRHEPWCTVLSETGLPGGDDPVSFLAGAVAFLNEKVWGTLNATLIVHPSSLKDPAVASAVEKAIRELRYGTVAVNTWPAAGYALVSLPWGGHPSSTARDIQSGLGWVHNTLMLEQVEKSVLRAPLTNLMAPPWVPGHRGARDLGTRLVDFERAPSWLKLPGVAAAALRR